MNGSFYLSNKSFLIKISLIVVLLSITFRNDREKIGKINLVEAEFLVVLFEIHKLLNLNKKHNFFRYLH